MINTIETIQDLFNTHLGNSLGVEQSLQLLDIPESRQWDNSLTLTEAEQLSTFTCTTPQLWLDIQQQCINSEYDCELQNLIEHSYANPEKHLRPERKRNC